MKKFTITTAATATLAAAALGSAAAAAAAPTGPPTAADTIQTLQASGHKVILNRVGAAPLSECSVTSIRPGRAITETVPAGGGDTIDKVLYTTIYVDVRC